MSTCWHGKEGVCEICYAIIGDGHLRAVEISNGEKEKDKKKDPELDID